MVVRCACACECRHRSPSISGRAREQTRARWTFLNTSSNQLSISLQYHHTLQNSPRTGQYGHAPRSSALRRPSVLGGRHRRSFVREFTRAAPLEPNSFASAALKRTITSASLCNPPPSLSPVRTPTHPRSLLPSFTSQRPSSLLSLRHPSSARTTAHSSSFSSFFSLYPCLPPSPPRPRPRPQHTLAFPPPRRWSRAVTLPRARASYCIFLSQRMPTT